MKKITFGFMLFSLIAFAQKEINPKVKPDKPKEFVINQIEKNSALYKQVAKDIWGYAELGFKETQSTSRLQSVLSQAGFTVQAGVSGMPTAFVATYGSSGPVIGILAEFDALPGLS
jgi:aminobenzoyl-glutamate utilization protein B